MTTILVIEEVIVVVMHVILHLLAFFVDNWDHEYRYHNYWGKYVFAFGQFEDWATGRDLIYDWAYLDWTLEAFSIAVGFAAYPKLQLGISEATK